MNCRCKRGNAMVEYSILLSLLAAFTLLAFTNLGGSIRGLLAHFQDRLADSSKINANGAVVPASSVPVSSALSITGSVTPLSSTNAAALKSLMKSSQEMKKAIVVVGVNGATEQLASALEAKAKSLLASGEIDDSQANLIIKLANNGYYLASAQKAYEDAVAASQQQIVFEGETYSLDAFGGMLGFTVNSNQQQNWEIPPDVAGKFLSPFATTYQQVKQNSMFANASVNQQLSGLIMQIGANADALGWAADELQKGTITPEEMTSQASEHFLSNMNGAPLGAAISSVASGRTDQTSSQICTTGGGEDKNGQCGGI